ncbi:MAG: hypothetical protein ACRD3O_19000 [Terriglobia bacterium]
MDIEKAMQFMLEHQARHDAAIQQHNLAIQQLDERDKRHDERIAKNEEQIASLADLVGRLAQAEIRLVERMNTGQKQADERLNALSDRVDAFIVFVEKYIESHGNGHQHE